MLTLTVLVLLYFLPAILARNKRSFTGILLLNLLLGWTGLGWIAALVWALAESEYPRPVMVVAAPGAARFCCVCGSPSPLNPCRHCGR